MCRHPACNRCQFPAQAAMPRPAYCVLRVRDLNQRLKAEQKNLERTRKQASPREREPELQRQTDLTAEKVPSDSGPMQSGPCSAGSSAVPAASDGLRCAALPPACPLVATSGMDCVRRRLQRLSRAARCWRPCGSTCGRSTLRRCPTSSSTSWCACVLHTHSR